MVKLEEFLNETSSDLEESANLHKLKGDLYYFKKENEKALEEYKSSLDLSFKSNLLNNKLMQRELNESIARCLMNLNRLDEALEIAKKLEETAQNFEAMTTSLNLKLDIYKRNQTKTNDSLEDELVTVEKLINLHPLFINLWIALADLLHLKLENVNRRELTCNKSMNANNDNFNSNISSSSDSNKIITQQTRATKEQLIDQYLVCFVIANELIRHGYQFRSEIVMKQKQKQKLWLSDAELNLKKSINIDNMEKILSENLQNIISENLEKADKLEDNEKLMQAKNSINHEHFSKKFFDDYKISIINF